DTLAKGYQPMLSEVIGGELLIAGLSGWDTGKPGRLDLDFIEAAKKHVALAHAFLEKGANINAVDKDGGTALHWAVGGNKPDTVRLLLERGAKPDPVDSRGQTPLDIAERKNSTAILTLIRKAAG
ncbi:MAG TPA: ankyrin repeat domain-containing protein, partial [Rhizobiales bacterium]|nr:ankyrin repeat domain-containing protein [Hyphomicrobiales bacterium]